MAKFETEEHFMTVEEAESMLRSNHVHFGLASFKYCANVCNLFGNLSSPSIDTKEIKCLESCADKVSDVRQHFIQSYMEKLGEDEAFVARIGELKEMEDED